MLSELRVRICDLSENFYKDRTHKKGDGNREKEPIGNIGYNN